MVDALPSQIGSGSFQSYYSSLCLQNVPIFVGCEPFWWIYGRVIHMVADSSQCLSMFIIQNNDTMATPVSRSEQGLFFHNPLMNRAQYTHSLGNPIHPSPSTAQGFSKISGLTFYVSLHDLTIFTHAKYSNIVSHDHFCIFLRCLNHHVAWWNHQWEVSQSGPQNHGFQCQVMAIHDLDLGSFGVPP